MTPKKELKVAYWVAIILLLVGVVSYAIPVKKPDQPVRKMFDNIAGKVLFTHQKHASVSTSGYGVACIDCHHHYEKDKTAYKACGECHTKEIAKTVAKVCLDCHEPDETHHGEDTKEYSCSDCHKTSDDSVPQACADCHEDGDLEGMEKPMDLQIKTDAFHNQCTACHKQYGQGPMYVDADCSKCHVQ